MLQAPMDSHGDLISLWLPDNGWMDSMEEQRRALQRQELGARVAALREAKRLSQPALASDAGMSQPSLWAIERGATKEITARSLIGLAAALGTTVEYLWQGRGDERGDGAQEAELIALFRRLDDRGRFAVLQSARALQLAAETAAQHGGPEIKPSGATSERAIPSSSQASAKRLTRVANTKPRNLTQKR